MMEEKVIPTKPEIDALAEMYLTSQAEADKAQEAADVFKARLADMVRDHGFLPKRAQKSRRLEGMAYQVTLSKGQSVEVDGTAVLRLKDACAKWGLGRVAGRLFKREPVFVLQDGAQDLVARLLSKGAPSDLHKLFSDALVIKANSPTLKVEPRDKDKKDKKEAKAS